MISKIKNVWLRRLAIVVTVPTVMPFWLAYICVLAVMEVIGDAGQVWREPPR